jgi:sulfotransferase
MSSPVLPLVGGLARLMSQENEGSVFIDDDQRARILTAAVDAYYADIHPAQVVLDTNRGWAARLSLVARLWPKAKMVLCVRNPAWVVDSVESLTRRNALEPSGIFKYDATGTVYSRAEGLASGTGMLGFALGALRDAVHDPQNRSRLLLVRYESLVAHTRAVLERIYAHLDEPPFDHDPDNIEQDFEALEFDLRIGAPGLHSVAPFVRYKSRPTILPPDLFRRYEAEAFWERPGELASDVAMI